MILKRYHLKCELPKVIIRLNIGPILAAKSRLLLLGQCHCLHWSSAGPTSAAFFDYLNSPTFSRNLAQYRHYTKPIVIFTMASSSESRRARVGLMDGTLLLPRQTILEVRKPEFGTALARCVSKTSAGGQSLGQNWPPSDYRSYHSSNGSILAADLRQIFVDAGPVLSRI